jgi:hypothetical protein
VGASSSHNSHSDGIVVVDVALAVGFAVAFGTDDRGDGDRFTVNRFDNPGRGDTDPGRGDIDPGRGDNDPARGDTDPGRGDTDPGRGDTDPGRGDTDPDRGESEPVKPPGRFEKNDRRGEAADDALAGRDIVRA